MPGVGVGGLISNLINPGLNDQVARVLTPNPAPLAQQQPGGATADSVGNPPPGANMAPAAVTQPDPVNSQYIGTLLKASQQAAMAADLNRNLQGVAAGFGTAQQQASKQQALGAGEGNAAGDYLGQLKTMQGLQENTIGENEHARFMAGAATFAQTLSTQLGRPVSVQEATEIMNNPDTMKSFSNAMGANAQTTETEKNADAATRAWAQANPQASPQDIANYKAMIMAQGMSGGLSAAGKSLYDDRRQWHLQNPGKSDADMIAARPELANEIAYTGAKTEEGKQMAQAAEDKLTATQTFAKTDQSYKQLEDTIDWLNDPAHKDAVLNAIATPAGLTQGVIGAGLAKLSSWGVPYLPANADVNEARAKIDYLKSQQYSESFTGTKNLRSNTEANKLGASASNIDNINNQPADIQQQLTSLQQRVYRERANTYAAAGKAIPTKYEGLADSTYTDPTSKLFQGGHETLPAAQQSDIDEAKTYIAAHPSEKQSVIQHFHDQGFNAVALQ